jgi:ergothioneine biosynthesis protein EgtB
MSVRSITPVAPIDLELLSRRFRAVRDRTVALTRPLAPEDAVVQSMPSVSPSKWHLAHTTWFFERFVLARFERGYAPYDPAWDFLFNSYYQSVGPRHPRAERGLLSRPTLAEIAAYRAALDGRVVALLAQGRPDANACALIELGIQHEQQHQELLLADIKHVFSLNPLRPVYGADAPRTASTAVELRFLPGPEGLHEIGHAGAGFAFDNETPRHRVLLYPHAIANRLVTNAEYLAFIDDGGYRRPELWLSDGWATVEREGWQRPLYWSGDNQRSFTLRGECSIDPNAPVCHVGFYEADAYARWRDCRLPSEAEWEVLAAGLKIDGNFQDHGMLEPEPAAGPPEYPQQLFGDVWEWTASPYLGYPGFRPLAGSLGEYNGKFMSGQWVLRGGSCVTPREHIRASYRNFFYPSDRWQFMGIRLVRDG